jgi:hypothetical protein
LLSGMVIPAIDRVMAFSCDDDTSHLGLPPWGRN